MRQLLGGQLPGGADPAMSAPQPQPAIAADPAPSIPGSIPGSTAGSIPGSTAGSTPGSGPRNGAGQPAPTTVQSATTVSAPPTQVQAPRPAPANAGAPAPAQANGKPGGTGKEDEEDWWTE